MAPPPVSLAKPIARLTILVGAGVLGSILLKKTEVPRIISGASKASKTNEPPSDPMAEQINSLNEKIDTLVTANGAKKTDLVGIAVVAGCSYLLLKDLKISDMMRAARRGLSITCTAVANKLESISAAIRPYSGN